MASPPEAARAKRGGKALSPEELEQRRESRLRESMTGTGFRDWVFGAAPLIQDCRDNLEPLFEGLQELLAQAESAAHSLDDDNWVRFTELPSDRVHMMDHEVHTSFFSKVEPTWRPLLTMPKGGTTCIFLHLGMEPTTEALGDLLEKMGWFGVSVCPRPPPSHLHERIEHIPLDPTKDAHEAFFKALATKKGGKVPKPKLFKLVFVKALFDQHAPIVDSDEEEEAGDTAEGPAEGAAALGSTSGPKELSTSMVGFGRLGVTRRGDVRRRLRALRNYLNVALSRLDNGGGLVVTFPGIPFHPVLFFLTSYLRGLFLRVHLLTPENIKSWEIYVLCMGFKREDAENPGQGGGSELKSFFEGAYRSEALDDVLLWTLTQQAELKEVRGQKGSKARGYDELWRGYASKLASLAIDLGTEVVGGRSPKKKKAEAGKADKKPKEERPKEAAAAKPAPAPAAKPAEKPAPAPAPAPDSPAAAPAPAQTQLPPVAEARPAPAKQDETAAPLPPPAAEGGRQDASPADVTKRKPFRPSRSTPWLACSLGAGPGYATAGFPDRHKLAEKYPLVLHALDCTEQRARRWHRRRLLAGSATTLSPGDDSVQAALRSTV